MLCDPFDSSVLVGERRGSHYVRCLITSLAVGVTAAALTIHLLDSVSKKRSWPNSGLAWRGGWVGGVSFVEQKSYLYNTKRE